MIRDRVLPFEIILRFSCCTLSFSSAVRMKYIFSAYKKQPLFCQICQTPAHLYRVRVFFVIYGRVCSVTTASLLPRAQLLLSQIFSFTLAQ